MTALQAVAASLPPVPGQAGLKLELGRLAHPAATLEGLAVYIGGEKLPGAVELRRLIVSGHVIENLRFDCPQLEVGDAGVGCRGARLTIPGLLDDARVDLGFNPADRSGFILARDPQWGWLEARLHADGKAEVDVQALPLEALGRFVPPLAAYAAGGVLAGKLAYRSEHGEHVITAEGGGDAGRFSTADGLQAGENLQFSFALDARSRDETWHWQAGLDWSSGEAYLHPLYVVAGPSLRARGRLAPRRLFIDQAALVIQGIESFEASAEIDLDTARIGKGSVTVERIDLAQIGPRFIAPLVAPAQAESIRFAGFMDLGAAIDAGGLSAFDLSFDQAGFSFADSALAVGPLSGVVPWRSAGETRVAVQVDGGRWQKLQLGAFGLEAVVDGSRVRAREIAIPILDGRLLFTDLDLVHARAGWSGRGGMVVEPISMKLLTDAVGLPPMSGVLSASMPGLSVRPGEVALEGALVISLFDGYLRVTGLQVLEPFGSAPHLYGDIEARNLDLFQLTETFSFGSISGFVDADVRGLELARWAPVRFDAEVRSSPGDFARRISQRAVENIGALGGPGAALAIQRGFLSFFDSFGYREIGLSCKLSGNVCVMGGIAGERGDAGFTIVQGGGVPALNVIGYNRRVDWVELVDRIKRVVESNAAPVIK